MGWFYDELPGFRLGLKTKRKIFSQQSKFQKIQIFEMEEGGRLLALNGAVQTTEFDGFIYHEMIAHIPLLLHHNPKNVLIIGDGDGGLLLEVLRHKVKRVTLVDIDDQIIAASKKYLSKIHNGSFFNKRARVLALDGIEFIKNFKKHFDVIIIGSTDPVGAAKNLFSKKFYQDVAQALTDKGIMVAQTGGIFVSWPEFKAAFKNLSQIFFKCAAFTVTIPTYPSGLWSFVIASKQVNFEKQPWGRIRRRYKRLKSDLKFYNPEIHRAAFILPNFIKRALRENKKSVL